MRSGSRISNSSASVSVSACQRNRRSSRNGWQFGLCRRLLKDPVLAAYPVLGFVLDFAVYKVFHLFASLTAAGLPLSDFYRFPQSGLRHRKNLVGQTIRGHCLKTHRVRSACPEHLYQGADCHSDREMQRPRCDPAASQIYDTLWHRQNLVPVLW